MITKEEAVTSDEFHHGNCHRVVGPRGNIKVYSTIVRRGGKTKTWKRSPESFKVPVKHGIKTWFWITEVNSENWHTKESCPLKDLDDV